MIIEGQQYLNEKEVASKYALSLRWIRKIRYSAKDFPYYKLNGRVYYKEIEVDNWLKANLIPREGLRLDRKGRYEKTQV